jgi:phenylpropionate dioxygenase-like ring-hydroxylating dioxygenase large terminal subunit
MPATPETSSNWHIAATSAELGTDPLACKIGNTKIVLFRQLDGSVAALADLCPHQDLPLSTGWIVGGAIECLHHGLRFDGSGKCIHMPAQDPSRIPERFKISTFEVKEDNGRILVSMPANSRPKP